MAKCNQLTPLPCKGLIFLVFLCLRSSADGKYEVSYKPNVVIHNDGDVLWIPPAIYRSSCPISVKYFPFDEQKCEMNFGSWTFNADQVTTLTPSPHVGSGAVRIGPTPFPDQRS